MVHVNATAFGGGVAEMLYTLVPLMRDMGDDRVTRWRGAETAPFLRCEFDIVEKLSIAEE